MIGGYVAQIDGFTMYGSVKKIQAEWEDLKSRYRCNLVGKELKFFEAKISGTCFVVTNCKPVKTMTFEG